MKTHSSLTPGVSNVLWAIFGPIVFLMTIHAYVGNRSFYSHVWEFVQSNSSQEFLQRGGVVVIGTHVQNGQIFPISSHPREVSLIFRFRSCSHLQYWRVEGSMEVCLHVSTLWLHSIRTTMSACVHSFVVHEKEVVDSKTWLQWNLEEVIIKYQSTSIPYSHLLCTKQHKGSHAVYCTSHPVHMKDKAKMVCIYYI